MRMLLYQPGCDARAVDVEAEVPALAEVLGTEQYEWMTVRLLSFCVIHDPDGRAAGKPLNRMLGKTPIFGDFLVCGIEWDDNGVTKAISLTPRQMGLLTNTVFNKFPTGDNPEDNLPSFARK